MDFVQTGQDSPKDGDNGRPVPQPGCFHRAVGQADAETRVQDEMEGFVDQGKRGRQPDVRLGRQEKNQAVIQSGREKWI